MSETQKRQWASAALFLRLCWAIGILVLLLFAYYGAYRVVTEVHTTKRGNVAVPFPAYFGMWGLSMNPMQTRVVTIVFAPAHLIDKRLRPARWAVSQWNWTPTPSPQIPVTEETNSKSIQGEQNAEPELPIAGS